MNITVPCPRCSGTGYDTFEDRHAETNHDVCKACGGEGVIPARTGETREASAVPEGGLAPSRRDCVLAIADGEVIGAGPVNEAGSWFAQEPAVTEVVRMPAEAAGRFLFRAWPGRAAALNILGETGSAVAL
ncbi:hypothetical protein [Methylobacterium haplocladii]|uniref:Uncharacterized protein n=1 Tax=Methylobacterium haplocladii TaxID=1176176 RepID=A0A512ISB1_9HYPH|nr:hypothetical protein [Methylobacterium haplocladii]GEP00594.1 hypothetical protein MHA02_29810 [Methylobacterium haplocladii]GJD85509.1 hypothetical protein HPGCJGGD_3398 [Methylobacterium haplocladii]GLS57742.1 hypothetical protein GCM10007887_03980 [Methylobacterium haplocladii]